MNNDTAKWIDSSKGNNNYLPNLLDFAASNYGRHTDWFLKHRDTGLKNLALILTAEFTVLGLHFTKTGFPKFLVCLSLVLLSAFSILIAYSACQSCKNAFKASLESALLVTKTAWAMGLVGAVSLEKTSTLLPPVPDDEMLYTKRYWEDALPPKSNTTEDFVDWNMRNRRSTYFWGNLTLFLFSLTSVITTSIGMIAVCGANI
ncbi:hypothetical protein N2488_11655 [SAR92 clade bacterium H231]|nr:hypothetical protein [SAR92 clade bacterium H231]